jgi:hypothetical protein
MMMKQSYRFLVDGHVCVFRAHSFAEAVTYATKYAGAYSYVEFISDTGRKKSILSCRLSLLFAKSSLKLFLYGATLLVSLLIACVAYVRME